MGLFNWIRVSSFFYKTVYKAFLISALLFVLSWSRYNTAYFYQPAAYVQSFILISFKILSLDCIAGVPNYLHKPMIVPKCEEQLRQQVVGRQHSVILLWAGVPRYVKWTMQLWQRKVRTDCRSNNLMLAANLARSLR